MKRVFAMVTALSMLIAACGGGDTSPSEESTTTIAAGSSDGSQPASEQTTTTQSPADPAPSGDEGTGTATIGDTTYEFSVSVDGPGAICDMDVQDAGLLFVIVMYGEDDEGRTIAMNVSGPISGGSGAGVLVQVGSPFLEFERWTADATVYSNPSAGIPEGAGATLQVDGNTVSGSGVFYDDTRRSEVGGDAYDAGVLDGTFEATCPSG